jgi:hypothetical protein
VKCCALSNQETVNGEVEPEDADSATSNVANTILSGSTIITLASGGSDHIV